MQPSCLNYACTHTTCGGGKKQNLIRERNHYSCELRGKEREKKRRKNPKIIQITRVERHWAEAAECTQSIIFSIAQKLYASY